METVTSRATQRRAEQRVALVAAAERRIAMGGAAELRARDLAQDIGVALGAIYNLVADLDELVLLVAGRTLARLDAALEQAAASASAQMPAERLKVVARAYLAFARSETRLWRSVFDDGDVETQALPAWIVEQQARMFRHIVAPLEQLAPEWEAGQRKLFAHTLFTAAHGVVSLGLEQRLAAVPADAIEGQLDLLIDAITAGLLLRR